MKNETKITKDEKEFNLNLIRLEFAFEKLHGFHQQVYHSVEQIALIVQVIKNYKEKDLHNLNLYLMKFEHFFELFEDSQKEVNKAQINLGFIIEDIKNLQ